MMDPEQKDYFMAILSTFLGAGLAFFVTRLHDSARRYRENVAAANLALFAVKSQLNEFLLFRKGLHEDMASDKRRKELPIWMVARPSFQTYVGYTIDFKSLGFLFEKPNHGQLFDVLHLSQTHYLDLVKLDEFRNTSLIELHRELAKLESTNPQNNIQDDEKAVGRYILAAVESAIIGVARRARDDEEFYQDAFLKLRVALKAELCVWWRRGKPSLEALLQSKDPSLEVWWPHKEPSLIDIKPVLPRFEKKSLPEMPVCVLDALAKQDLAGQSAPQKESGKE